MRGYLSLLAGATVRHSVCTSQRADPVEDLAALRWLHHGTARLGEAAATDEVTGIRRHSTSSLHSRGRHPSRCFPGSKTALEKGAESARAGFVEGRLRCRHDEAVSLQRIAGCNLPMRNA